MKATVAVLCAACALWASAAERYRYVRDYKVDGKIVRLAGGEKSLDLAKLGLAGWKPGDAEGSRFATVETTYESDSDKTVRLYYSNEWFGEFLVNGESVASQLEGPADTMSYLDIRVRKGANSVTLRTRAGTAGWHCAFAFDGEKSAGETDGEVDLTRTCGKIRPLLHSSGFGPLICSCPKSTIDVLKTMNLAAARTHDWALINPNQRVCDYFHIFPLMNLDATKPENYHFGPTDYLLKRTREEAGMEVFYRLGTSIEHSGRKVHFNALIPEDFDKVAETFAATVRHYNRGWANGFNWNIRYWEIWNEPEGRDNMWCLPEGYDDGDSPAVQAEKFARQKAAFMRFFVICLKRLKSEFPDIQVGGPALCSLDWLPDLLKACREAKVAPDFISWHYYGSSVEEILGMVSRARKTCDDMGFRECQLVLNEWHYRNCGWLELRSSDPNVQKRVWSGPGSHNGIDAATFTLAVLARFQASALDQGYYYGCSHKGAWGYKDAHNRFYKTYYALKAFGEIVNGFPVLGEVKTSGTLTTLVAKTADLKRTALLVADYRGLPGDVVLDVKGLPKGHLSARILDDSRNLKAVDVKVDGSRIILPKGSQNSACYLLIAEDAPTKPRSVVFVNGLRSPAGTRDQTHFELFREGDDALFRFATSDETPSIVPAVKKERDLEAGDRLEVYLSAREDLKDWYYCLEFDLQGRVLDYRAKSYRQMDYGWRCPTLRTRALHTNGVFTVEARVSVRELERLGLNIDTCSIGVFRADTKRTGDDPAWYSAVAFPQGREPDFHTPAMLKPVASLVEKPAGESFFKTRGFVVYTADLSGSVDWPRLAHDCGVNTIATHVNPPEVIAFMKSERGRKFMKDCERYGIRVEHELHAMSHFVPRALFRTKPELFRIDEKGVRNPDGNFCVSNPEAVALAVSNAVKTAKVCVSTTGRHFFWRDDGPAMACHCPACSRLTVSEQAVVVENAMVRALRAEVNPEATLAHLAYGPTCPPPVKVKPDPAIFLEYAPFRARADLRPLDERNWSELDALLGTFPAETAQVLEYSLDESLFCHWRRYRSPIRWDDAQFKADISKYASRGIRHITTFAAWMDDAYIETIGDFGPVYSYGRILSNWR